MGVYAQTNYEINCDTKETAKKVVLAIKKLEEDDAIINGNIYTSQLEIDGTSVIGFLDSGRIQNLEYKANTIISPIEQIKGVETANFPFLSEADGVYWNKE